MRKFMVARQKELAKKRIENLFAMAEKEFKKFPKRSNRYVEIARNIGMRFNARIPPGLKRKFCKHCYSYLQPGVNCRVRTKNRKVVIFCANCKGITRIPFVKEKKLVHKNVV